MKNKVGLSNRKKIPEKITERWVIYGIHPDDKNEPKRVFGFWASKYLMTEYPCVGDIVTVLCRKRKKDGTIGKIITTLYITDLQEWKDGDFEPTGIARCLYKGKKHRNFEYEIDE